MGQQVAKRLTGFDTNTIYYDIVDIPDDVRQRLQAVPVEFDELLRESDIRLPARPPDTAPPEA